MGRFLLLTVALLGSLACSAVERASDVQATGHEALACQTCHQGGGVGGELASVPSSSCASADCHRTDNPRRVVVGSAEFDHRGHASTGDIALGCAGCHTHDEGGEELWTEEVSCALCHRDEMSGANGSDCKSCHVADPEGFTSQGVAIPHDGLSWIAGGCVRCHYDVSEAEKEVSITRCELCHADANGATRSALGDDLHPTHAGVTCTSCHVESGHRILAMSSAVSLVCKDCHSVAHDLELSEEPFTAKTCNACHAVEHTDEQAFLLGLVDVSHPVSPSEKFLSGLTCRSCHSSEASPSQPFEGSPAGCVGCHSPEYGTVLDFWREGLSQRTRMVETYLGGATSTLGQRNDSVAALLSGAGDLVATLRRASGVHNLPLAHQLLERVLELSTTAYQVARVPAPTAPNLGREPRMGTCSYCHYARGETVVTEAMDTIFHREVMGLGR